MREKLVEYEPKQQRDRSVQQDLKHDRKIRESANARCHARVRHMLLEPFHELIDGASEPRPFRRLDAIFFPAEDLVEFLLVPIFCRVGGGRSLNKPTHFEVRDGRF